MESFATTFRWRGGRNEHVEGHLGDPRGNSIIDRLDERGRHAPKADS
jgi:hypothetical protein